MLFKFERIFVSFDDNHSRLLKLVVFSKKISKNYRKKYRKKYEKEIEKVMRKNENKIMNLYQKHKDKNKKNYKMKLFLLLEKYTQNRSKRNH